MKKGKGGQGNLQKILVGILVVFIFLVIGITLFNRTGLSGVGDAATQVGNMFMSIFGPLFNVLLDLNGVNATNQFLVVLSFILISIIIISTLDSINIFGEETTGGNLINFFVGIIVAIIGVRFMPQDLWSSLTAPSSAFVAAILLMIPLVAMFFISMKSKSILLSKLLWIFYIVFNVYLLMKLSANYEIRIVYIIALLLAGAMLFFDSTVRHIFNQEMHKTEIEDAIGNINAQERYNLRRKIENWEKIKADETASPQERGKARAELNKLSKIYGDISQI